MIPIGAPNLPEGMMISSGWVAPTRAIKHFLAMIVESKKSTPNGKINNKIVILSASEP